MTASTDADDISNLKCWQQQQPKVLTAAAAQSDDSNLFKRLQAYTDKIQISQHLHEMSK